MGAARRNCYSSHRCFLSGAVTVDLLPRHLRPQHSSHQDGQRCEVSDRLDLHGSLRTFAISSEL